MRGPFDDLSKLQIDKLYKLLMVHIYSYSKNQEILPTIKNENLIAIVLSGSAQIINNDYNGNELIIEELKKDSVFGTNMTATDNENYEIIAKEDTKILIIDYDKLFDEDNIKHNYFNIFFRNIFDIVNSKYKISNERIRVLERKQIRDKLLEYFEIEYKKHHSKRFDLPFSLKDLADYMAVNRSAMFRELKNLKEEHFVEIKGKRVTLLYK